MTCATKYNGDLLNTKIQTFDEQDSLGLAMSDLVGNGASFYFLDAAGPDPLYSKNCPKDVQTLNTLLGNQGVEFYCDGKCVMLRDCKTHLQKIGAPPTTTVVTTSTTTTTTATATTVTTTTSVTAAATTTAVATTSTTTDTTVTTTTAITTTKAYASAAIAKVFGRMTCATMYNTDLLNTKIQNNVYAEQESVAAELVDSIGNGASFYFFTPAAGPDPLYSKNCPKDVQTLNKVVGDGYEFYCGSIYLSAEVMLRKCTTQLLSAITTTLTTTSAVASTTAFTDPVHPDAETVVESGTLESSYSGTVRIPKVRRNTVPPVFSTPEAHT